MTNWPSTKVVLVKTNGIRYSKVLWQISILEQFGKITAQNEFESINSNMRFRVCPLKIANSSFRSLCGRKLKLKTWIFFIDFSSMNEKLRKKFNWQEMSINKAKLTAVTSQLLKAYDPDVIRRDLSDSHTTVAGGRKAKKDDRISLFS